MSGYCWPCNCCCCMLHWHQERAALEEMRANFEAQLQLARAEVAKAQVGAGAVETDKQECRFTLSCHACMPQMPPGLLRS